MPRTSQPGKQPSAKLVFTTKLLSIGPKGAWTFLQLTKEQSAKLGSRGLVAVTGTLNGLLQQNARKPGSNESPKQFGS